MVTNWIKPYESAVCAKNVKDWKAIVMKECNQVRSLLLTVLYIW